MIQLLTSRWVLPIASPPLEGGLVAVEGDRIVGVHPHGFATADRDFGNAALMPGLVNAHTHLDLTGAKGRIPPRGDFTGWLEDVIAYRRSRTAEQIDADVRTGLAECMKHGVTTVGDIVGIGSPLPASPIRRIAFREIIGGSPERFDAVIAAIPNGDRLSLHAPYSVNHAKALELLANTTGIAMHVAESAAEMEFLESQSGPFVGFLNRLGVPHGGFTPTAQFVAALEHHLIVHGNHLDPATVGPRHAIVYCPRTHAAFGHRPYPLREFLARGATVALGTDSLASNPDLDVLAEAQFVHRQFPDIPAAAIVRMITHDAARALRLDHAGALALGGRADLAAIALPDRDGDVHELLLAADRTAPRTTIVGGVALSP
jgi:cytosine/adenosine deaminase-related metal-dependent hydrolase